MEFSPNNIKNHPAQRLLPVDFLRGLVIVLMTIDHSRDIFNTFSIGAYIGLETPMDIFLTRWITHICAPVFIFLAGFSAYLNKSGKNLSRADLQIFLLKRGAFLIILEFTLISFLWNIIFNNLNNHIYSFSAQVIWTIGISMIFLSLLLFLKNWMIFSVGIFIIMTNNLFDIYTATDSILWNFLHVRSVMTIEDGLTIRSSYPLYPWLGLIAIGYGFCSLFYDNKNICPTPEKRQLFLYKISLSLFISFLILRFFNFYGDISQFTHNLNFELSIKSFLEITKYPPSLHYILITLAIGLFMLGLAENKNNMLIRFFSKYGNAPLFYYIAHLMTIPVLNFILGKIFGHAYPWGFTNILFTWLAGITIIVMLYPAVLWFINFKKRNRGRFPILNYL